MYEKFYRLSERPFGKTPDPKFLYKSHQHEEALERMLFAIQEKELAVLTGDIGSGKTTISRSAMDTLDDRYMVVNILNPRLSPTQFLKTIAKRLGIEDVKYFKHDIVEQMNERIAELYEGRITPVVFIDEAQLIPSKSTIDEIRLLTNYQLDNMNLMTIILIGQTEFRDRLQSKYYNAFRQRIGIAYHLGPLSFEDTGKYISFRLTVAGRSEPIFTGPAVELIYKYSKGVPRAINTICNNALLYGYGEDLGTIDDRAINAIIEDIKISLT
ncbi:MAG: AAA family ATPase [Deltaproteobacteria bacterium]|nr:AAA family ATPase [Deltaproteobacteria bacterium]MCL5276740.1 AAA family ATPase [Deltaproteobacteria bacterium]